MADISYDLYIKKLKEKYNTKNATENLGLSDTDIDVYASREADKLNSYNQTKRNEQANITAGNVNSQQIEWANEYEEESLNWWERMGAWINSVRNTVTQSFLKLGEGLIDFGAETIGMLGTDEFKQEMSDFVKQDLTNDFMSTDFYRVGSALGSGTWMFGLDEATKYAYNDNATSDWVKNIAQGVGSSLGFAAMTAVPVVGWGLAYGASSGMGIEEALNDGATAEKAYLYGLGSGAVETATELFVGKLLNVVGKGGAKVANKLLGTKFSGNIANNVVAGIGKGSGSSIFLNLVKNFNEEGMEEVVSDVMNPILKMIYKECDEDNFLSQYGKFFEENGGWEGLLESYFYGGASAALMGGVQTGARIGKYRSIKAVQFETSLENVIELNEKLQKELEKNDINAYPDPSQNPKIAKLLQEKEWLKEKIGEDFKDWLDTVKAEYDAMSIDTRDNSVQGQREALRQVGENTLNSTIEDLQHGLGEKAAKGVNYKYVGTENVNKTNLSKKAVYINGKQSFREYMKSVLHENEHIASEGLKSSVLTDEIIKGMSKEDYNKEFEKQSILEGDVYLQTAQGKKFLDSKNLTYDKYSALNDNKKIELKKEAAKANPAWFNEEVAAEHLIDYFANFKEFNRVIDGVSQKGIRKILNTFRKAFANTSNKPANYDKVIKALQDGLKAERNKSAKITSDNVKNRETEKKFGNFENTIQKSKKDDIINSKEVDRNDIRRILEENSGGKQKSSNNWIIYGDKWKTTNAEGYGEVSKRLLQEEYDTDPSNRRLGIIIDNDGNEYLVNAYNYTYNNLQKLFKTVPDDIKQMLSTDHKLEEFKNAKLTLTSSDGSASVTVLDNGDIINLINYNPNSDKRIKGFAKKALDLAVLNGGMKMDNYNIPLSDKNGINLTYEYSKSGFVPVSATPYNAEFVNETIREEFTEKNQDQPIMFMMYTGKNAPVFKSYEELQDYIKKEVVVIDDWDKASAYRDNKLESAKKDFEKYRITEDDFSTTLKGNDLKLYKEIKGLSRDEILKKMSTVPHYEDAPNWILKDKLSKRDLFLMYKQSRGIELTRDEISSMDIVQDAQNYVDTHEPLSAIEHTALIQRAKEEFREIIFKDKTPKKEHKLLAITGLPGSGKSTGNLRHFLQVNLALEYDNDIAKGVPSLSKDFANGYGAGVIQPIVKEAQNQLLKELVKEGYNIAFPMVGGESESVLKKLAIFASAGYKDISVETIIVTKQTSANRATKRFISGDDKGLTRFVGLDYIFEGAGDPEQAINEIISMRNERGEVKYGNQTINIKSIKKYDQRGENQKSVRNSEELSENGITGKYNESGRRGQNALDRYDTNETGNDNKSSDGNIIRNNNRLNDDERYRITEDNKDFDEVINADNYTKNENLSYDRYLRNTKELRLIAETDNEKILEIANQYIKKVATDYYNPFVKEIKSDNVNAQNAVNLYYNYVNSLRALIDYRDDILEFATQNWQDKFDADLAKLVKNLPKAKELISKYSNVKAQEVLNTVTAIDTRTAEELEEIERERTKYTSRRENFEEKLTKKKVDVNKFKNTALQLAQSIKSNLDNVKIDKPFIKENTKTKYYNEVVAPFDTLLEQYKITLRDVKIGEDDIKTAANYLINDMLGGRHYRNARLKKIDFIREQYDNLALTPQEIVNTVVESQPVPSTVEVRTRFINNSRKVATPDMAGIKAQADLRKDGKVYTLNSVMNLTKTVESTLRNEPALSNKNVTIDYEGSTRELKSLEIAMILNEYNNTQYVKEESKKINYSNLTNEQKIDKITDIVTNGITLDYNGETTRLKTLVDANDAMGTIVEEYVRAQVENLVNNEGNTSKITKVLERQEKAFKERLNALKQRNSALTNKIIELNRKIDEEKQKGKDRNKELIKKYTDKIKELKKQSSKEINDLRKELRQAARKIDTLEEKSQRKEALIRKYQRKNMELYTDNKGMKKIKYDDILMLNDLGKQINPDFEMSAYVENQIVNYLSRAEFDKAVDLYMNAILNSDYVDGDEVKPYSYYVGDYSYGDDLLLDDATTFENDIKELRDEMIEIFKGSEISTRQKFIDKLANMATYNHNLKMKLRETKTSFVVYRHAFRAYNTAKRIYKKVIDIDKNGGSKSGNRLAGTSPEWVSAILDFAQGTDTTRALNKMTPEAIINGEHKEGLKNLLNAYNELEKADKVAFKMDDSLKAYINYLLSDDVALNGKYVDIYKRVLNGINRLIEEEISERKIKFGNIEGAIKDVSRRMQEENRLKSGEKEETFKFTQSFLTPLAVVDKLAKYQEEAVIKQVYEELFNAEMKKEEADIRLREPFIKFREKNKSVAKSFFKSLSKDVEIHYAGKTLTANKSKLFSLYEAFKREQAQGHITNKFGGIEIGNKVYQFETFEELQSLIKAIEKEFNLDNSKSVNAQYLKACEKFFEIAREYKRQTDIERLGFTNVEDGFYFPIAIANADAQVAISSDAFFKINMPGTANYSFNQNTTGTMGAIKLLDIEDIIERHSRQMATYAGYGVVTDNIRKLWNYKLEGGKTVRQSILSRFVEGDGRKVERFIATLVNDVQGIGQGTNSNVDTLFKKVVGKLRGNVAKVALGANPKVMLSQTASIPAAMRYIKGRYLLQAFTMKLSNLPEKPAMLKYRENHELVGQAETQGAIDKLGSIFTRGINFFDKLAVENIWKASLLQTKNADGSWNVEEATKLVQKTVFDTQPNYLALGRSEFLRSKNDFVKLFTMFQSQAQQNLSMAYDSINRIVYKKKHKIPVTRDDWEDLGSALTALFIQALVYTGMGQLFSHLVNNDWKDKSFGEYAGDFGIELINDNLIGMIPLINNVEIDLEKSWKVNIDKLGSGFIDNYVDIIQNFDGFENMSAKDWNTALSYTFGLPGTNVYKWTKAFGQYLPNAEDYFDELDTAYRGKKITKATVTNSSTKTLERKNYRQYSKNNGVDASTITKMYNLYSNGYTDVIIKAVPEEITLDGVKTPVDKTEFLKIYGKASSAINTLLSNSKYTDEQQAKLISKTIDIYYDTSKKAITGESMNLLEKIVYNGKNIDADTLYAILEAKDIEADEKNTRKDKITKYINKLRLSKANKYFIYAALGYKVDSKLYKAYLTTKLRLTNRQIKKMFE